MAAVEAIQFRSNLVFGTFTHRVAGKALLEGLLAGGHILCLRDLNHRRHKRSRRK
jgi:hypothetical protein